MAAQLIWRRCLWATGSRGMDGKRRLLAGNSVKLRELWARLRYSRVRWLWLSADLGIETYIQHSSVSSSPYIYMILLQSRGSISGKAIYCSWKFYRRALYLCFFLFFVEHIIALNVNLTCNTLLTSKLSYLVKVERIYRQDSTNQEAWTEHCRHH